MLQAHEAVAQVAVLALPDEIREEEVMACVVPMPGVVPGRGLAERLADHCLERLAYFKAPGWVLFVERLPTTGTQKVQKAQIFPRGEDPRARPGRSTSAAARSAAESAGAGPSAHALQSTAWLFPSGPHVWPRSCVAASWSWTARWAP